MKYSLFQTIKTANRIQCSSQGDSSAETRDSVINILFGEIGKQTHTSPHTNTPISLFYLLVQAVHLNDTELAFTTEDCGSFFYSNFLHLTRSVRSKSCLVKHNKGVVVPHVWQENTFSLHFLWLDLWSNHFISLSINKFPTRFSTNRSPFFLFRWSFGFGLNFEPILMEQSA